MRCRVVVVALVAFSGSARGDAWLDITKGDATARDSAVLEVLRNPEQHAGGLVRRALYWATRIPNAKHLPHITNIVKNDDLDSATRAAAALALGHIGKERPDLWPPGEGDPPVHRPLPVFARNALLNCVLDAPTTVRRACAEALGIARIEDAQATLAPMVSDAGEDAFVRVFAGRAITRITGILSVSEASLQAVVNAVVTMVSE